MTFKFLNNFFCLQVPYVDVVVFASTYNPLATCYTIASENAVFVVFMPTIRFQAFRRVVIPKPQRVIQSGRQNIFAVR